MDIEEIRQIEKVADRLAALGPSGVRPSHCWFCGKIGAWFFCDCQEARDAQAGKRTKPRAVQRNGRWLMVLDEEIVKRNEGWGFARHYVAPSPTVDTVDTSRGASVDSSVDNSVDTSDSVDSRVDTVDRSASRRAYKAEHERQRRAKQKDAVE